METNFKDFIAKIEKINNEYGPKIDELISKAGDIAYKESLLGREKHWPVTGFVYKKKEYRKFASAEEFAPFREWWVKYKKPHGCVGCEFMRAGWYSNEHVMFLGIGHATSFEDAFRNLEFEDGSPFGIEI